MTSAGITIVRIPPRSPNCNPHIERFFRSLKEECLNRIWFVGDRGLTNVTNRYCDFYNHRRPHQEPIGNRRPRMAMWIGWHDQDGGMRRIAELFGHPDNAERAIRDQANRPRLFPIDSWGIANQFIEPDERLANTGTTIKRRSEIGGTLNFYHCSAA